MAGPQSRPRIELGTGKAPDRACVHHLGAAVVESQLHVADHRNRPGIHRCIELARRALGRASFRRSAFVLPGRKAAVEDEDVLDAEDAERPPHTWCRIESGGVVDHKGVGLADAEAANRVSELLWPGQHMWQV